MASPYRILTGPLLREAWRESRDASSTPGKPGIDTISATSFGASLDANIRRLQKELKAGTFKFRRLRGVSFQKQNSTKERVICVPCVEDRLVQRALCRYLIRKKAAQLGIDTTAAYGFMPEKGVLKAVQMAKKLRSEYSWILKTDIVSFFDQIKRPLAKAIVRKRLRGLSIVPLLEQAIDLEVHPNTLSTSRQQSLGIYQGRGIRQGMPLSPLLANLLLSGFDRAVEKHGFVLLRYADDLAVFCNSRDEAERAFRIVKKELGVLELGIPQIAEESKTKIVGPTDALDFLGRQIVPVGSPPRIAVRLATKRIAAIAEKIENEFSVTRLLSEGTDFRSAMANLRGKVATYLGAFPDIENGADLNTALRTCVKKTTRQMLVELFGTEAVSRLDRPKLRFLGLDAIGEITPINDTDIL